MSHQEQRLRIWRIWEAGVKGLKTELHITYKCLFFDHVFPFTTSACIEYGWLVVEGSVRDILSSTSTKALY